MDILAQLKTERDKVARQLSGLDTAIAALSGLHGRAGARRPRRRLSAAARARIAAAQRARWARVKGQQKVVPIAHGRNTGKRTMSAAARRKISAAQRERWAKVRAQKKGA
jgi:hypothetical protein